LPLARFDGEADTGLLGTVLRVHVAAPETVALLQAQRVEGGAAGGDETIRPSGLPEQIPEPAAEFGPGVELPTELAHIRDTQRLDEDLAHRHRPRRVVGEGGV